MEVRINRTPEPSAQVEYEDSRLVGGYFGYRQTSSTNKFSLSTNVVRPGDSIRAHLDSNNNACQHKIKEFKYKLFRRVTYVSTSGKEQSTCEYLTYTKLDGVKRGDSTQKECLIEIPQFTADGEEALSGSCQSLNFSVVYSLRCFVKWQSIFEIGPGHCIEFPLTVLNRQIASKT